ncbi:HD-GYP domain-containing protein [Thermincola potens]|uniref:Metal dependent phosphohydrolase n=1 Tax=Thermincola potens (strain JR) TaxID=635013 RepID=D5XCT0_THEPJ|nr:HD-GYP domain-containing protein [Thermincola potens]ADG83606.1 metal dependent phosphohydrolase [Thermincola potens JR]
MKTFSLSIKLYIVFVVLLAAFLLVSLIPTIEINSYNVQGFVFFLLLAIFVDSLPVSLPRGGYVTVSMAVDYASIILFGPAISVCIMVVAIVLRKLFKIDKSPWYKVLFNCAQIVLAVGTAGVVFQLINGKNAGAEFNNLLPLSSSAVAYIIVNCTAVSIILALSQRISIRTIWMTNIRWLLPNLLLLAPLGLLMANVYRYIGFLGIVLFFIPLLLARFIFKAYMDLREIYFNTLEALASAIDAKDRYTRGHSERVSEYATLIARAMKLPEDQVEMIQHMALLHDVGKIGISDDILCKRDKLTAEEFEIIKGHSGLGAKIIEAMEDLAVSKEYILYHHEQYAGGGYPHGLSGEDIPLGARIISVADAFDAMTSDRAYRPRRSFHEAFAILEEMSGQQFDPQVVKAFLSVMDEKRKIQAPTNCDSVLSI